MPVLAMSRSQHFTSPVPMIHCTDPSTLTPAHRAQLMRSNKKVEQLLGVTPQLLPIGPRRSSESVKSTRLGRERSKTVTQKDKKEKTGFRVPKTPTAVSASSSAASLPLLRTSSGGSYSSQNTTDSLPTPPLPNPRRRPPTLKLDTKENVNTPVASPSASESSFILSPLTPSFQDNNSEHQLRLTKMSRLQRHFGETVPVELVYPPSPTSCSRSDPKRYTYGLPPTLTSIGPVYESEVHVYWQGPEMDDPVKRVMVMNALRQLKA